MHKDILRWTGGPRAGVDKISQGRQARQERPRATRAPNSGLRAARSANNFALSRRPPKGRRGGRGGGGGEVRTAKREARIPSRLRGGPWSKRRNNSKII
eukprot:7361207-Pyramimonas_sp.AAC.1